MMLYSTPRSHFSRKVRILLAALNLDVELIDVGNVADISSDIFGSNPLMKVPTLVDKECVVFESDHIAQYLVRQYDKDDQFHVLIHDIEQLNTRTIMNGVMSAEVELILAARTGITTDAHLRFDKIRESIIRGLEWLEYHAEIFQDKPSYLGFHLVSMWDHLTLYDLVPLNYPKLHDCVRRLSVPVYVKMSAPK